MEEWKPALEAFPQRVGLLFLCRFYSVFMLNMIVLIDWARGRLSVPGAGGVFRPNVFRRSGTGGGRGEGVDGAVFRPVLRPFLGLILGLILHTGAEGGAS